MVAAAQANLMGRKFGIAAVHGIRWLLKQTAQRLS
jgi:hypothetical protein